MAQPAQHPTLAQLLWPTLSTAHENDITIVLDNHGRLALVPVRPLHPGELGYGISVQVALDRGLLVLA